jgi:hypothetical protein
MDSAGDAGVYGLYFKELQALQKGQFLKEIKQLLVHARSFNFVNYKQRLSRNGALSDSELTHLEVVGTIVKQRLDMLQNQEDVLIAMLGGKK